jgi:hypothetical protein
MPNSRDPGRDRSRTIWAGSAILAPAVLAALASPASAGHEFRTIYPVGGYNHACYDGTLANRDKFCQTDNLNLTVFRRGAIRRRRAVGRELAFECSL